MAFQGAGSVHIRRFHPKPVNIFLPQLLQRILRVVSINGRVKIFIEQPIPAQSLDETADQPQTGSLFIAQLSWGPFLLANSIFPNWAINFLSTPINFAFIYWDFCFQFFFTQTVIGARAIPNFGTFLLKPSFDVILKKELWVFWFSVRINRI